MRQWWNELLEDLKDPCWFNYGKFMFWTILLLVCGASVEASLLFGISVILVDFVSLYERGTK